MDKDVEQLLKKGSIKALSNHQNCYAINDLQAIKELLLPLNPQSHKGNFGHVLVVEGHENFMGASRLVALAALRVGAGLCTLLSKDTIHYHPNDLFEFTKTKYAQLHLAPLKKISSLVIGPGLSQDPSFQAWGLKLLTEMGPRLSTIIIDADGLSLLCELKAGEIKGSLICTPHPQEAALLLKTSVEEVERDRFLAITKLGQLPVNDHCSIIWILKGSTSLVYQAPNGIFAIEGNAPLLSTGGSGDVLAGAIAGLIPQSSAPLSATLLATTLMVTAARESSLRADRGILPSELAHSFPHLLKRAP